MLRQAFLQALQAQPGRACRKQQALLQHATAQALVA
jgi:hypothetical protein